LNKKYGKWTVIMITIAGLGIASMMIAWALENMYDTAFGGGNVAVIPIRGVIVTQTTDDIFDVGSTSSETVLRFIKDADDDPAIKAIMLDINSPGGSPVATDEIARAVKRLNKTTIAVIHDVGASGAYWVASSADTIVANPMSIVGSIGVYSSYIDIAGLMDKYGLKYNRLIAGEHKDLGSPFRNLTISERTILQLKVDKIHDIFIDAIAENRGLPRQRVEELATGIFYLGVEAEELGLVDMLGTKDDAVEHLEESLGIKAELVEYRKKETVLSLLSRIIGEQSFLVGHGIGSGLVRQRLQIFT